MVERLKGRQKKIGRKVSFAFPAVLLPSIWNSSGIEDATKERQPTRILAGNDSGSALPKAM